MTKRRLGFGIAAVLCLGGVAVWSATCVPGVHRLNYARIRAGMTQAQVEALLGGAPGNHRSDGKPFVTCLSVLFRPGERPEFWYGDDGDIRVDFDGNRRVVARRWMPRRATYLDRALDWLAP